MNFFVEDFLVNVIKSVFFVYLVKFTEEIFNRKFHFSFSELFYH